MTELKGGSTVTLAHQRDKFPGFQVPKIQNDGGYPNTRPLIIPYTDIEAQGNPLRLMVNERKELSS